MTSLYIDRRGVDLTLDGEALVFHENGERIGTVPIAPLSRVFLRGDVRLSSSLLGKLGQAGIGVIILSVRKSTPTMLLARPHNDAARRIAQFEKSGDKDFCLEFSRRLVVGKIAGQINLLENLKDTHLMARCELTRAGRALGGMLRQIPEKSDIAQLRGLEGAAANVYFGAFAAIIPEGLKFTGRNRRPPRDPVNAALSLTYTMMHAEAVPAAYGGGLDPYIGFYHALDFGRESHGSDLIEPLRPVADTFILRMFKGRDLRIEDFSTTAEGCFLGKSAFYGQCYAKIGCIGLEAGGTHELLDLYSATEDKKRSCW